MINDKSVINSFSESALPVKRIYFVNQSAYNTVTQAYVVFLAHSVFTAFRYTHFIALACCFVAVCMLKYFCLMLQLFVMSVDYCQ